MSRIPQLLCEVRRNYSLIKSVLPYKLHHPKSVCEAQIEVSDPQWNQSSKLFSLSINNSRIQVTSTPTRKTVKNVTRIN